MGKNVNTEREREHVEVKLSHVQCTTLNVRNYGKAFADAST